MPPWCRGGDYVHMIDLLKASQGDREALEKIVAEYGEKAKRIASIYLGNDHEDIVQDVWLKIMDKCHLLSTVQNFDNWLFLVVRNACFNYLKAEGKHKANCSLQLPENNGWIDDDIVVELNVQDETIFGDMQQRSSKSKMDVIAAAAAIFLSVMVACDC